VAYDEDLADRIRELTADEPARGEQRMFGGLAFLIGGHMAVAASGQGGLLVRVDPTDADALLEHAGVRPMQMRGRPLRGWLLVEAAQLDTDERLAAWVGHGTAYARTLPPKAR
jgi:hypothetical protein